MNSLSDNLRGAIFMMVSMAGFALNDAVMKFVLADVPLMPAIFIRGLVTTGLLALLCWHTGVLSWRAGPRDRRFIGLRAAAEIGITITFLTALANMPIASATAILQSAPLVVTFAAATFLGEAVGWRRTAASSAGFVGVLLIVRPGAEDFNVFALFAVAAVGFIVLRDLSTRMLSEGAPSLFVALVTSIVITAAGGLGALGGPWPEVSAASLAIIALGAVFLIFGYVFSVLTMRSGDLGFTAPFRYTILLWALLLGVIVFREIPDLLTVAGSLVVVGTGLFTFARERRLARPARPAPSR